MEPPGRPGQRGGGSNPTGRVPNQTWTGSDAEDFEQSCMPPDAPQHGGDDNPGRHAFVSCNCA